MEEVYIFLPQETVGVVLRKNLTNYLMYYLFSHECDKFYLQPNGIEEGLYASLRM